MTAILDTQKPIQIKGYQMQTLDQEVVLYQLASTQVVYLNPTAALIWQLCSGAITVAEMINILVKTYPDSASSIRMDVLNALEELCQLGVIELE